MTMSLLKQAGGPRHNPGIILLIRRIEGIDRSTVVVLLRCAGVWQCGDDDE